MTRFRRAIVVVLDSVGIGALPDAGRYGDEGSDTLLGDDYSTGYGNDSLQNGNDSILGGNGTDRIWGGGDYLDTVPDPDISGDYIEGGEGADTIRGDFTSQSTGYGNTFEGDDTILGGTEADSIFGDSGGINAFYGYGDDSILGGDGADTIYGESGAGSGSNVVGIDTIYGEGGGDRLQGDDGSDVYMFVANDTFSLGADLVVEGADSQTNNGGDLLDFQAVDPPSGTNGITLDLSSTSTQTVTTIGQLQLQLSSGTGIERVNGSNHPTRGNDTITGNSQANILDGKDGADSLLGGSGNDTLTGGSGTDILYGDAGNDLFHTADSQIDTVYGGAGNSDDGRDRDSNDVRPLGSGDVELW